MADDLIRDQDKHDKSSRAVEFVRKFMVKSRAYRQPHLDLANECRDLYQCWVRDGRSMIHRANLRLPYAFSIIEDEAPKIVEAMLRERPIAQFEAHSQPLVQFEAPLGDYLDNQLEQMKFPAKISYTAKALLLDGTCFAKVPFVYQERTVIPKDAAKDPYFRVEYDGPDFEPIAFVDFFPDPRAREPGDIASMNGCAHRVWKTLAELKRNKKYKNIEDLETSMRAKGYGQQQAWSAPYYSEEGQAKYDQSRDNTPGVKMDGLIEVWEYWGLFDVKGDGTEIREYVITVGNGDVELRCEENYFDHKMKPFVAAVNCERDGEFFGIPELIAIRSLLKEANSLRNARLDQVNLAINQMFLVDRAAGVKHRSLYSRPSGIIWTNDINGVKPLPGPQLPPSATQELQELQMEMKDALGVNQGAPQLTQAAKTFGRSATGVQYINAVTASRVGQKLRNIGEQLCKPMLRIMLKINDQFVSDQQWVRTSDPDTAAVNPFTQLPPSVFADSLDFRIKVTWETGGEEAMMGRLNQLTQILQAAEATQPGLVKWDVLFETIGKTLVGRRYKKFIRSDEERAMLQQQALAMEQAAQQQAGAAAPQPNAPGGGVSEV